MFTIFHKNNKQDANKKQRGFITQEMLAGIGVYLLAAALLGGAAYFAGQGKVKAGSAVRDIQQIEQALAEYVERQSDPQFPTTAQFNATNLTDMDANLLATNAGPWKSGYSYSTIADTNGKIAAVVVLSENSNRDTTNNPSVSITGTITGGNVTTSVTPNGTDTDDIYLVMYIGPDNAAKRDKDNSKLR